jgi:serine/threonine-protein kinase
VLRARARLAEARTLADEASAFFQRYPDWTSIDYHNASDVLTAVLTELGDFAALEALHRNAVDHIRALVPADDPQLAFALAGLAHALLFTHKDTEAEPLLRECVVIRLKKIPDNWITFDAQSMLSGSLLALNKYAEAEPLLLSSYEGLKQRESKIPLKHRIRLRECLQRLVQLYEATDQAEKAAGWNKKLAEFDKIEAEKKTAVPVTQRSAP